MGLRINTNTEAIDTLRNLTISQNMFDQSMQRLSSGKRINSAADDAAGYAISQKLTAQNNGLTQASANAQDGISMIQTAAGGLQTTQQLLQRMRQLAVQSANDTNTSTDRQALQSEANQITQEITQISSTTQFNTKNLLDGTSGATAGTLGAGFTTANGATTIADGSGNTATLLTVNAGNLSQATGYSLSFSVSNGVTSAVLSGGGLGSATVGLTSSTNEGVTTFSNSADGFSMSFQAGSAFNFNSVAGSGSTTTFATTVNSLNLQVGANTGQNLTVGIGNMSASALGVQGATSSQALDISSNASAASNAIGVIDNAIQTVSTQAASLGAVQNRLQASTNNLAIASENMQAAYSAITNVNMAQESTNLASAQILQQSGISMLAQANQAPQGVLKLLG